MKTHPDPDECLDGLGEKVVAGLSVGIARTRTDLVLYRQVLPQFVVAHTPRGLANWIHDVMWGNVVAELDGVDDVYVIDDQLTREVVVSRRETYRLRVKRHDEAGRVASYRTQYVLDFYEQKQNVGVLPGFEEIHLIAGYTWNEDSHEIGSAVLSYRDGEENVVWLTDLPDTGFEVEATPRVPAAPEPPAPQIELASEPADESFGASGDQTQ